MLYNNVQQTVHSNHMVEFMKNLMLIVSLLLCSKWKQQWCGWKMSNFSAWWTSHFGFCQKSYVRLFIFVCSFYDTDYPICQSYLFLFAFEIQCGLKSPTMKMKCFWPQQEKYFFLLFFRDKWIICMRVRFYDSIQLIFWCWVMVANVSFASSLIQFIFPILL